MTRDEIVKLTQESGFRAGHITLTSGDPIAFIAPLSATSCIVDLERFAALVAAAERDACAQIVQSECIGFTPEDDQLNCIVAAIRARSIQPPKGGD